MGTSYSLQNWQLSQEIVTGILTGNQTAQSTKLAEKSVVDLLVQQGMSPDLAQKAALQVINQWMEIIARGASPNEAIHILQNQLTFQPPQNVSSGDQLGQSLANGSEIKEALSQILGKSFNLNDPAVAAFLIKLEQAMAKGVSFASAVEQAVQSLNQAQQLTQNSQSGQPGSEVLQALSGSSPTDILTTMASGLSQEQMQALQNALQTALSNGGTNQQINQAVTNSQQQVQTTTALANSPLSPADQLSAALSSGNVSQSTANLTQDLLHNLANQMAQGSSPADALQTATQQSLEQTNLIQQQSVPLSDADRLALALASGQQPNSNTSNTFVDSLAQGQTTQQASNNAANAEQSTSILQANGQSSSATSTSLVESLATGNLSSQNNMDNQTLAVLSNQLAQGTTPSSTTVDQINNTMQQVVAGSSSPTGDPALTILANGQNANTLSDSTVQTLSQPAETTVQSTQSTQEQVLSANQGNPTPETSTTTSSTGSASSTTTDTSDSQPVVTTVVAQVEVLNNQPVFQPVTTEPPPQPISPITPPPPISPVEPVIDPIIVIESEPPPPHINQAAQLGKALVSINETDSPLQVTGVLSISDMDSPATFQSQTDFQGKYGLFSIDSVGNWKYFTDTSPDYFLENSTYTDTFSVMSSDGTTSSVTIKITGSNDAANISSPTIELTETDSLLSCSGTLTITDADSATTFQSQSDTAGRYGTFSLASDGKWSYDTTAAWNSFAAGTTYTDTFSVASSDGTTSKVTINIAGSNDAASLSAPSVDLTETDNLL
ncbi:MAG: hypothetical protein G8345_13340, partial [Magnetococcales bacterium]|nr:hypothetical protein [Magnetococcales bacterium]